MLFMPGLAEGSINWFGLAVTVVIVAILWVIVRFLLKITLKIFAIGCLGLLILTGVIYLLNQLK